MSIEYFTLYIVFLKEGLFFLKVAVINSCFLHYTWSNDGYQPVIANCFNLGVVFVLVVFVVVFDFSWVHAYKV